MNNDDVELNELLGLSSVEDTTNGASAGNSTEDVSSVAASETATNEEPSKRAQDRIRELAEENRKLREAQERKVVDENEDLDGFLNQIQDEGTRTLLKKYGEIMKSTIQKDYNPVLSSFKENKFEQEFAQFAEKLPNLANHKEELKKAFTRNPNADLKGLIGTKVVDILSAKIVPLETKAAQSPRNEQEVDLDALDKDGLYALLKAKKN